MTDKQVARYTHLVDRKAYIVTHSGASWKPEYGPELEQIDRELAELRTLVDREHEEKGTKSMKQYMTAAEVAEVVGVSLGKAYQLIRDMNRELKADGYLTVSGKVPVRYFEKKYYGFERAAGD